MLPFTDEGISENNLTLNYSLFPIYKINDIIILIRRFYEKKICIFILLFVGLSCFAEDKETVSYYVGDDIAYSIKFNKDRVAQYNTTIIKAVLPYDDGYVIKFANKNNFIYEIYAKKGTEVYLEDEFVLKIIDIYPNGFFAELWEDKTIRKDTSHK